MAFVISPSGMAQATCGRPRIGLTRPLQVSTHARGLAARCGATPSATRAPGMLVTLQPVPVVGMASSAFPAQKRAAPVASAAASTPAGEAAEESNSWMSTLTLGALFGLWYLFNIWFNIYNKQVLKAFPHPLTITAFQFLVGSAVATTMWALRLHPAPKTTPEAIAGVSPLAAVHTLGNALTNVSLGAVAVSFTHTIKALEPFFSVLLSALFLGEQPSAPVILSLFPIIGGVALASTSELSFTWKGFLAAMGSNVTFQSRNVLSKKFMGDKAKGGFDNINLFSIITILAFFILTPVALIMEGAPFLPSALTAAGITNHALLFKRALLAGLCFHAYQQVSYMILQRVSPVTHSIGNCVKRVVVIVASVFVFQNPVTKQNALGTAIALAGVFGYSQVKRLTGKKKQA